MKTLRLAAIRCSLMFTAVAALSIAYPASGQAVPTTYVYTGNPFTQVMPPYTTSDFVSGMVTFASPLPANMPLTAVAPLAFSFSDGVQTLNNSNTTSTLFEFATGPTGIITGWVASVFGSSNNHNIHTHSIEPPWGYFNKGHLSGTQFGSSHGAPGTWANCCLCP